MKITKSQLKQIILEEATKVKKEKQLREQLESVQKELDEIMGGPAGGGKKTFKSAKGDFVPNEFPGALVEKETEEDDTYSFEEEELDEIMDSLDDEGAEVEADMVSTEDEFSEEELDEMFSNMEEDMVDGEVEGEEESNMTEDITGSEGAESTEELDREETVDKSKTGEWQKNDDGIEHKLEEKPFNLQESAEVLRMKKLAGLI